MANLNKIMLIGRLTRDVEVVPFNNGGKVAKFGFAVNNRKMVDGTWTDVPVFIDCEAYNRGETGKLADNIERFLRKGSQAFLEGHLQMDEWTDKTTQQKRTKLKMVVETMQLLDPKDRDASGNGDGERADRPVTASAPRGGSRAPAASSAPRGGGRAPARSYDEDEPPQLRADGEESDIPF